MLLYEPILVDAAESLLLIVVLAPPVGADHRVVQLTILFAQPVVELFPPKAAVQVM
jgi:hypothetical protein